MKSVKENILCEYDVYLSKLGHFMHFNFGVVDCVLFAFGRNYSTDITCHPAAGQIFAIHNDFGIIVGLDNRVRFEYSFQVGFNSLVFNGKSCICNVIISLFG